MNLRTIQNAMDYIRLGLGSAAAEEVPSPQIAAPGVSGLATAKKILIIDDDLGIMPLLSYGLKQSGYGVFHGGDGREALVLASECMPDLIIIDINLPGMKGDEAARMLKKDEKLKHIPVILMSSKDEEAAKASASSCADAYLNKPFNFDDVCSVVKKYCAPVSQPVFASYASF